MFTPKRSLVLQSVIVSLLSTPMVTHAADTLLNATAQSATANSSTTGSEEVALYADVNGTVSDFSGKPLEGAIIIIGKGQATTDATGKYKITGLEFGSYSVKVSKTGYSFDETKVTLSATNPNPILDIKSVDRGNLAQIALGTHSCKNNSNQILLLDSTGKSVRNIDSTIVGKGIGVVTTDWDSNGSVDFLVASNLFAGNDAFVFDTKGNKLSSLPISTFNKGVRVVFGTLENGETAIVSNQGEDKKIYLYANGKEPTSLDILKNSADVNIVIADLNNDNYDEIIVISAQPINGTNALVLDNKGKALASLLLTLDGKPATTNLPGLVGTEFVYQDKSVLAIGNATGSKHQVALYSFDKDFKPTFIKNFNFMSSGSGVSNGTDLCTLKGNAGLLLSYTVIDNKPALLVAENGGKGLISIDGQGKLLKKSALSDQNSVISSVSGTNIDLNLKTLDTLPPPGVAIKDVAVIGTEEKPLEVEDREVDGNVHFENVVIGKITITINANITFGKNVRFKHKNYIPKGVNLGNILRKIQQPTKKIKKHPPAINLMQSIVINAPTILQQIQTQVPAVAQEQTTGNLTVDFGQQRFTLKPVKIKQGEGKKPKGFSFEATGEVTFVTEEDHEVGLVPAMEDSESLATALEQHGIGGLEAADSGQMTAEPTVSNPDVSSYAGTPEIFSEPADDAEPEGLQSVDAENLPKGNKLLRALIFKDKKGKKRKQKIYPYFAQLDFGHTFNIDSKGIVSLTFNGISLRGMLDYGIKYDFSISYPSFDVKPKVDGNYVISYPSGGKQTLFTIK
jgi:hypothetical protein